MWQTLVLFWLLTGLPIFPARYWAWMVALPFRINNQMILGLNERSHSAVAAIDASGLEVWGIVILF
jgi:hypothetical protein